MIGTTPRTYIETRVQLDGKFVNPRHVIIFSELCIHSSRYASSNRDAAAQAVLCHLISGSENLYANKSFTNLVFCDGMKTKREVGR
jgi:hypothetical protein